MRAMNCAASSGSASSTSATSSRRRRMPCRNPLAAVRTGRGWCSEPNPWGLRWPSNSRESCASARASVLQRLIHVSPPPRRCTTGCRSRHGSEHVGVGIEQAVARDRAQRCRRGRSSTPARGPAGTAAAWPRSAAPGSTSRSPRPAEPHLEPGVREGDLVAQHHAVVRIQPARMRRVRKDLRASRDPHELHVRAVRALLRPFLVRRRDEAMDEVLRLRGRARPAPSRRGRARCVRQSPGARSWRASVASSRPAGGRSIGLLRLGFRRVDLLQQAPLPLAAVVRRHARDAHPARVPAVGAEAARRCRSAGTSGHRRRRRARPSATGTRRARRAAASHDGFYPAIAHAVHRLDRVELRIDARGTSCGCASRAR